MSRRVWLSIGGRAVLAALAVGFVLQGGLAGASPRGGAGNAVVPGDLQHPRPELYDISLDYPAPMRDSDGKVAFIPPIERAAARAALQDDDYLHYLLSGDLGGFEPAPIGEYIVIATGHAVTRAPRRSQVPFLTKVGRKVRIFGYVTGRKAPPTPFTTPTPTSTFTAPTVPSGRTTPPVRTGFRTTSGFRTPVVTTTTLPHRHTHPTTTTTTTTPSHPTTTTTTTTPPHSTTTTTTPPHSTTTTTTTPHSTTPTFIRMCNDKGTLPLIDVTNQEPGDSASDEVVLANCGTAPFALSMASAGTSNTLSTELKLVVTRVSDGHVLYNGPLTTAGTVPITDLTVGHSIELEVTLSLPHTAGNDVQNETATVDLYWNGVGT